MAMKRYWGAAVLAALLSATCGAKPPDLPVEQGVTCPAAGAWFDGLRRAVEGLRVEVELVLPGGEAPVALDALLPTLLPPLLADGARRELMDEEVPTGRYAEARHIFQLGESCRRQGDLDKARTCYEEAHLLSPTSRFGRLAMQRLHELEQLRDAGETQEEPRRAPTHDEPPLPDGKGAEQSYQKMLERSQPLGLVERSY